MGRPRRDIRSSSPSVLSANRTVGLLDDILSLSILFCILFFYFRMKLLVQIAVARGRRHSIYLGKAVWEVPHPRASCLYTSIQLNLSGQFTSQHGLALGLLREFHQSANGVMSAGYHIFLYQTIARNT